MRKFLLLSFFSLIANLAFSQMFVKEGSFHKVQGCITIPVHYDDNDIPMAVIKISTENISEQDRAKLYFEGNLATFIEVEHKIGEVWVYVTSRAATFLKIQHPDFGTTEFTFPVDIEAKQCYEMVLVSTFNAGAAQEKSKINYLVISSDRDDAAIYIDNEYVGDKEASKPVTVGGVHTWRIECKNYHTESGTITMTSGDAMVIERTMRPAYGFIEVNSQPVQDAVVFINGERVGKTPYKSDKMPSGEYIVRVMKEMYQTVEQTFTITDGNTTHANINMAAHYVTLTVNTEANADIYIDNEFKGKGNWTGKMEEGAHIVEARKENHKTTKEEVILTYGNDITVSLEAPKMFVGTLDINSNPMRADIYLDGELVGQTPKIVEDVPSGKHVIILKKDGYVGVKKDITIEDEDVLSINETLLSVRQYSEVQAAETKKIEAQKREELAKAKAEAKAKAKDRKRTFINVNAAYSAAPQLSYGITIGKVRRVGWYLSAMSGTEFVALGTDLECDEIGRINGATAYYDGITTTSRLSATAGLMIRVARAICLKLGAGYGTRVLAWHDNNDNWVKNTAYSATGLELNAGLMFMLGGFNISMEAVATDKTYLEFKAGIGFSF